MKIRIKIVKQQSELPSGMEAETDELIDEKKGKKRKAAKKKRRKKKKKAKAKKRDACYHKVKSRYDVWPSAYASGALVKCRKVGAKNWGNKSEGLSESKDEFKPHMMHDPKSGKSEMAKKPEDHERLAAKGYVHVDPAKVRKALDDEGGAAGPDAIVDRTDSSKEEVEKAMDNMPDVGKHKKGDYIKDDGKEVKVEK